MEIHSGPQSSFCLWHSWRSLTSQQHLQDFSWNHQTDIRSATICAKQLFLKVTLDVWNDHWGKLSRATSQGYAVSIGPSESQPKFAEAPSVSMWFLLVHLLPPALMFCWPVTLQHECGFATYAPHVIFFPFFLHYRKEQWQIKQETHKKTVTIQYTRIFFTVQILLMTFTQTNPCCYSSNINVKAFIYNLTRPYQAINNF